MQGLQLRHKDAPVQLDDTVKSFQNSEDDLVLILAYRPDTVPTSPEFSASPNFNGRESKKIADIEESPPASRTADISARPRTSLTSDPSPAPNRPNESAPELPIGAPSIMNAEGKQPSLGHISAPPYRAVPTQEYTPKEIHMHAQMGQSHNAYPAMPSHNSMGGVEYYSPYNSMAGHVAPQPYPWGHSLANPTTVPALAPFGPANVSIRDAAATHSGTSVKNEEPWVPSHTESPSQQTLEEGPDSSFNPDEVFHRQPSPDSQTVTELPQNNIRAIIDCQDPLVLEAGVTKSLVVLKTLKEKFSAHTATNVDAQSWIQAIDKLVPQAERKRTVVGVVGNTGAGKSSVINALLDEERLVPTNCMRACTAVVTEISWNTSTKTSDKYRAEIEFIGSSDWEKELHILMNEFLTENGTLSREVSDPNSDAGIAWAKFHSVYPDIPRDSLSECTVPDLLAKPAVAKILGGVRKIASSTLGKFYHELQCYVDSKEKVKKKGKEKEQEKRTSSKMEYWPLIKVVKIYTKSPALSTGACIVDLPGVHDSNAARAAVAQGYIKQCTGLWIVAPINRAVDDKAAKTLLGDSFKRQLKYDGGFSSVTFICSKTDDISITEAIDSLELEDEVSELECERAQHAKEIQKIEQDIAILKDEQADYRVALSNLNDEIDQWEALRDALDEGKTVYAPLAASNKRKRGSLSNQARKNKMRDDSDDDFIATDDDETEDEEETINDIAREPLSEDDIKQKLKELRDSKKDARRAGIEKKQAIDELKPQISELNKKIDVVKSRISRICIAGRNEYSKTAIQADFAAGVKEIDQENAAEEDEDKFNPDEEVRDYDQVAKSLPVFCVSSRAYQKMQGRLIKDDNVPGFDLPEETEIPQLQTHCRKLTESGRIQIARTFLLNFCQLQTTFHLWASDDGTGLQMTDEDKAKQVSYLKRRLQELETGLEQAVLACINEMRTELKNQIFDKCPELINDAIKAAPATASAWGNRDMGGLHWATYKAVVRRYGVYSSSSAGHRDFNADLVDPIIKKLATGWERAFQNRLPKSFRTYVANSSKILHAFHAAIEDRARKNGVGLARLTILKSQIYTYEQLYADLGTVLVTQMTELQREANRDFTPTIAAIMHAVYYRCTVENGPGSFKRMKELMVNHVEQERYRMFHDATRTVENHLAQMCKALQDSMEAKADEIFVQMNRDYMSVLAGRDVQELVTVQGRGEHRLRREVQELLNGVDEEFEGIANGDLGTTGTSDRVMMTSNGEPEGSVASEGERGVCDEEQQSAGTQNDQDEGDGDNDSYMNGVEHAMSTTPTKLASGMCGHDTAPVTVGSLDC